MINYSAYWQAQQKKQADTVQEPETDDEFDRSKTDDS